MGDKAKPVPVEGRHVGTPRERRPIREMTDAKVYTSERVCMGVCVCVRAGCAWVCVCVHACQVTPVVSDSVRPYGP